MLAKKRGMAETAETRTESKRGIPQKSREDRDYIL